MTPAERRTACIRVLAQIDQRLAEAEDLATQPFLSDYEQECLADDLELRRDARTRIEAILDHLESNR